MLLTNLKHRGFGFRAYGRAHRRSKSQRHSIASRRFSIEALEPRRLLSAGPVDPVGAIFPATVVYDNGLTHLPGMPAGFVTHSHVGAAFEFDVDTLATNPDVAEPLSGAANGPLHLLTSLPQLHSNPSATVKLFLDFDGHNEPSQNATIPVYDRDGDPTTYSDAELNLINMTWAKVSEDYIPFNIDVTTVEPPELGPGVPESVANGVALRVAIGGDGSWTGRVIGGVATIGAFTNSAANVVFIFPKNTGDGTSDGNAASHEAGHAFGLVHQSTYSQNGVRTNEYNPGDGNWAPIMGYPYSPVATWYNGTSNSGPTAYQDDMAILAGSVNGFGYRADDHGDTIASADALTFDGQTWTGSGLIGNNTDSDVWSFSISTPDTYRLAVNPATIGPNLDAVLELRDAAGSLIATASPSSSQAAELILTLTPASYFLTVGKTAAYGFLGAYTVSVTASPPGVTVSSAQASAAQPLVTREGGAATSFTVVLDTQPTADVSIPVSSSNLGEGVVSTASLLFTAANWNVPQTVSVTGVSDGVPDGDVNYAIILGAATSDDSEYAGIDPTDVAAVNLDNTFAGFLYSIDNHSDVIGRTSLHGTNVETLVDLKATFGGSDSDYMPRYLDLDPAGGKMYWTDSVGGLIRRANLNGSNVETVVSGFTGGGLLGIAVDSAGGKMYWADTATQKLQRANLDGSGVQDLITTSLAGVREIALDPAAGKLYWADFVVHAIRRANLDGTNVETVWAGTPEDSPKGLDLDISGGKMYWSDNARDKIMRANLNGSGVETLIDLTTMNSTAYSLAIDARAGKLYFSEYTTHAVYRANLDGSGLTPVAGTPGSYIQGIAILAPSARVLPSKGLITSESGGTATFQVTLNVPPRANVTIPVSSSNSQEGVVSTSSLTFTPANWNVPQTVTVTGVDDTLVDGNKAYSVILGAATSADPNYAGMNPADVSLVNNDNEAKFLVVDDATANLTYRYAADGVSRGSSTLASADSAPRGVAGNITGDKSWVIDANRNVYVYGISGNLLGQWSVSGFNNSAQFEGIATNGVDIWVLDAKSGKVYRYAGAASRLTGTQTAASSFSLNSGNKNPTDIVTDGTSIWVVDNSTTDKVFKYTLAGSLVGSWTITSGGGSPTGITIDPASVSDIWIVDSTTDRVYQFTAAASRTSGSQSPAASFALAAGNTNPQGITDPPARDTVGADPLGVSAASPSATSPTRAIRQFLDAASVQQLLAEAESESKDTWTRKSRRSRFAPV